MSELDQVLSRHGIHIPTPAWSHVGAGWLSLVDQMLADLKAAGWSGELSQVKQKFGLLRVYIGGATPELWDIIARYEKKSGAICEHCGALGRLRDDRPWILTLCDGCATPQKEAA